MNRKTILQLILTIIPLTGIVIISAYFLLLPKHIGDKTVNILPEQLFGWKFPAAEFPATRGTSNANAYSDIRDPGGIPKGLPVRLKIPNIGVDSTIEDAFITPDGRMDIPAGSVNVAWFALGPHPGKVGSAVIGGHYGIDDGVPKVFYKLDNLLVGDKVYIEDDKGDTLAFVVRRIQLFDRNADATTVFTSSDGIAHLNLITCEGIWNQVNDTYPSRRVVFTDSIPSEGAVVAVKAKLPDTAISLLTPAAQVPSILPAPTPENIISPSSFPQVLIESSKSLYATPIDGFITSLLLLTVAFVFFKILRR